MEEWRRQRGERTDRVGYACDSFLSFFSREMTFGRLRRVLVVASVVRGWNVVSLEKRVDLI